jgi:hypothetical protein
MGWDGWTSYSVLFEGCAEPRGEALSFCVSIIVIELDLLTLAFVCVPRSGISVSVCFLPTFLKLYSSVQTLFGTVCCTLTFDRLLEVTYR